NDVTCLQVGHASLFNCMGWATVYRYRRRPSDVLRRDERDHPADHEQRAVAERWRVRNRESVQAARAGSKGQLILPRHPSPVRRLPNISPDGKTIGIRAQPVNGLVGGSVLLSHPLDSTRNVDFNGISECVVAVLLARITLWLWQDFGSECDVKSHNL